MTFENKDNPQGRMKRLGQVAVVLRPDRLKAVEHAAIDAGVNRSQFIRMCIDAYFEAKRRNQLETEKEKTNGHQCTCYF